MSQNKLIKDHLIRTGQIDAITALKKYGCFRLAARIFDIKNEGLNITKKNVRHQGKTFAVYQTDQVKVSPI